MEDSRKKILATSLSSILSQILPLLILLLSPTNNFNFNLSPQLSSLILRFLFSSQFSTTFSLLSSSSRKRKRIHHHHQNSEEEEDDNQLDLVNLTRIDSFKVFFRMNSTTFEWLSGLLEPLLECRDPIDSPLNLSPHIRLGIGLFRLATGSDYSQVSKRFGVSESTSRFCTKQLCRVLCTNFRFWIAFPCSNELDSISSGFERINGVPNCCGVIDCARFKFKNEGFLQEETIDAQIVVDSSLRILSIVAGFRGDKGNSRVLKSSNLFRDIEEGKLLNSAPINLNGIEVPKYLIGDNGYPLLPWLIVPFVDPVLGSCEQNFNSKHRKMRLAALRTLASLRNWGILNQPIEEEFKISVACIGACSILHNALLMREDYSAISDEIDDYSIQNPSPQYYSDNNFEENSVEMKGSIIRNALAEKAREVLVPNQSTS